MKMFFLISIVFIGFFSSFFCFSSHKSIQREAVSLLEDRQDEIFSQLCKDFPELLWLDQQNDSKSMINNKMVFLSSVSNGNYVDYLKVALKQEKHRRISYEQFLSLKQKLKSAAEKLVFSYEEFCNCLLYSVVLIEIEESKKYISKSWVYGTNSLLDNFSFHSDIFPSSKKYCALQLHLIKEIIRIVQDKSFFLSDQKVENNTVEFCKEAVESAFFVTLATLAGSYVNTSKTRSALSGGYLALLSKREKEITAHLR